MAEKMRIPVGIFSRDITSPSRANGALITLTRENWPPGSVFTWRVYEQALGN